MENDLIRRSDALTEFEKVCNVCVALVARPMCGECSVADTVRKVKHIPTVDAVPVRHGHWEKERIGADKIDRCSVCGGSYLPCIKSCNYCPFCGALMDEVTK